MPSISPSAVCADCGAGPAPATEDDSNTTDARSTSLLLIRRRLLCRSCFTKYVNLKIVKHMESYRFKNQATDDDGRPHRTRLLLPLSGGVSGLVLLLALDKQLKLQLEKRGRIAYELILVHVSASDPGSDGEFKPRETDEWRDRVQTQFPNHDFLKVVPFENVLKHDRALEEDLKELGIVRNQDGKDGDEIEDDKSFITRLSASARTPTARSDLRDLLIHRLLVTTAKQHDCEGILWAHSVSRLAAKALADVATGRGGSVSSAMADGTSPWGLNFTYPVRELYTSELSLYLGSQDQDFGHCLLEDYEKHSGTATEAPVSLRNTSISNLLTGYISSQGEKYPSIIANVVRTAGKLQAPISSIDRRCRLCSMPKAASESALCYGCARMKQDIKVWKS